MAAERANPIRCSQYADVLVGSLTIVLGMERLLQALVGYTVSTRSVRAARMILDTLINIDTVIGEHDPNCGMRTYSTTIYAFRPFFTLFNHICDDVVSHQQLYKEDWHRLDHISKILVRAATSRVELKPISQTLTALTQIASCLRTVSILPSSAQAANASHIQPGPASTEMQPSEFLALEAYNTGNAVPDGATDLYPRTMATESFRFTDSHLQCESAPFVQSFEAGLSCNLWCYEWWQEPEMISR